jgi:predicted Fe-Mo cluster-binding NifX family protein
MKIAIASQGEENTSLIDSRFGRCSFFQFVDLNNPEEIEVVSNPGKASQRGAGVVAAQLVIDRKVAKVVAGNFGPNALRALQSANIEVVREESQITVEQAIKEAKSE